MEYVLYLILATIVVFSSIKCANYVDLIDKKTNISGAFIGGVILAGVTSMPELMTSITAIAGIGGDNGPGLVIGNVLGSNVFNLIIIAGLVLFSVKNFMASKIASSHKITIVCSLFVYALLAIVFLFNKDIEIPFIKVSLSSIIIIVVYIISLKFMAGDSTENEELDTSKLTIKQIVFRFILATLLLIIASIGLTYVADTITTNLNLGASLGGALFLGIATSLPELSSSIALVHKKNYNAMVGNVVGSNMFNFTILVFADIIYRNGSIYRQAAQGDNTQTKMLVIFGIVSTVITGIMLIAHSVGKNKGKKEITDKLSEANGDKDGSIASTKSAPKWVFYACSIGIILSYLAFLFFSIK
ncbi:MAG: cation transporter [Oscillospiraceae bacterium]